MRIVNPIVVGFRVSQAFAVSAAFILAMYIISCAGGSLSRRQFPAVPLSDPAGFSKQQTIGVYVHPSGQDTLDKTYASVVALDFMSLGYSVVDVDSLLRQHGESSVPWRGAAAVAESLRAKPYLSGVQSIAVIRTQWDSLITFTVLTHEPTSYVRFGGVKFHLITFAGWKVESVYTEVSVYGFGRGDTLLSAARSDTGRLFSEPGKITPSTEETPSQVIARQVGELLKGIPVCSVEDTVPARYRMPVVFFVDRGYRKEFPLEWRERLQRRLLYASDIFKKQFNIEFTLLGFKEWEVGFSKSVGNMLFKLWASTPEHPQYLQIGVTLDSSLTTFWKSRSLIGMAKPLGDHAVVVAQPTYPGLTAWNPLEESLTLVHEIGHILGAGHTSDKLSVMYPVEGWDNYLFDNFNRVIINGLKVDFLGLDQVQRMERYIRVMGVARGALSSDRVEILQPMARMLLGVEYLTAAEPLRSRDTLRQYKQVWTLVADSSLAYALMGYLDYHSHQWAQARDHLSTAVAMDPAFGEAEAYLSLALEKLSDNVGAEAHRKKAQGMEWLTRQR